MTASNSTALGGSSHSGRLAGLAALITGPDGEVGRSVAMLFAREGADVALGLHGAAADDAHADGIEALRRSIEAVGGRCLVLQGLPTGAVDSAWCDSAVQQTVQAFGQLDVLVNDASVDAQGGLRPEALDSEVGSCLRMAHAALPHLKMGASIINTGTPPRLAGGLHALTQALAANLRERGIRVNAVKAAAPVSTPTPAPTPTSASAALSAFVYLASPVSAGCVTGLVLAAAIGL